MPGIELLRTRLLAWTDRELVLASRADGRVLARWKTKPVEVELDEDARDDDHEEVDDEADEERGSAILDDVAIAWATLAHPERIAIEIGSIDTGYGDVLVTDSQIAFVDPATGKVERRTRPFQETHALCGWTPDGERLYVSGMGPATPRDHGPGLLALDAATGAVVGSLPFDDLPHCDELVFRPDGRVALSRSMSQYRAHLARLDIEGIRVPFEDGAPGPDAPRIDGASLHVGFAAPLETSRVRPLPGWREAVVVEAGYLGTRVVAIWDLETGERGRVLLEIPEAELLHASPHGGYPNILDARPAGDHVVIARGNGEIRVSPGDRVLPLRATTAERIALAGTTLYVARDGVVDAVRLDTGTDATPVIAADAGEPIAAIAADGAAGELVALTESGALRAFRIERA